MVLKIHSILGLALGGFILLMSFSGAILVFHSDLDQLQYPVDNKLNDNSFSVDQSYHAIRKQFPQAQISNCKLPVEAPHFMQFTLYDPGYKNGKSAMEVFLHPQTGAVLINRGGSDDARNNFMSWLSAFHSSFHLGKLGEWLMGFFALIFLLSIVTGLILYRKNLWPVLLFRKAVHKRNNLHQLIGIYALIFNLMIAVTGFWMQRYVFKKAFYAADNYTMVLKASPALSFSFDSAYGELQKKYPDFTAYSIYFAQSKTAIYGSRSSNAWIHSKKMADVISLDSAGNIAKTRFINEIDAADRYDIINSQLHMGRFGGAGIKIIYFIFGVSGGLLSITGFLLWRRRRNKK
jgi:uncharacterized iron-regulated membrane protein